MADTVKTGESRAAVDPERLKRLTELTRGFTDASSFSEIMRHVAEHTADLLDAEKAILMLADEEGLLRVQGSFGVSEDVVSRFRLQFDESVASRLQGLFGTAEGFLGVPLVSQGRVIGLLAVMRRPDHELGTTDEWLLSALADQLAAHVENAQLTEKIKDDALLMENARLYESERDARREAEAARAEAEAANRAKSEFIANMSHELRTPLNAIAGYVELLDMGVRGELNVGQREDLKRIAQNQRLLLSLINDVLNFARLEAGRLEFSMSRVPVHELLATMHALVMPQVLSRSLHYEYVPANPELLAYADPEKMQQVVLNLLANAIKYTGSGGNIRVSTDEDADSVFINVRDSGRGIEPDKIEHIFAPFVRIDTGYARTTEGTGLGLAISRDLARAMGGDLTATSKPGEGSTFTLRLLKRAPEI